MTSGRARDPLNSTLATVCLATLLTVSWGLRFWQGYAEPIRHPTTPSGRRRLRTERQVSIPEEAYDRAAEASRAVFVAKLTGSYSRKTSNLTCSSH
jgi:hypothetical protein